MKDLNDIYGYYKERIEEIKNYSKQFGDPWVFLMCACYIEFLVKMCVGEKKYEEDKAGAYKNFIKNYLTFINPLYKNFVYSNGKQDLPEQIYHILRCGLVHSFSLVPDKLSIKNGGRARSILLGHRKNKYEHLKKHDKDGYDSIIFTAEDFAEDLEKVLVKIFQDAKSNPNLENNIITWSTQYPSIGPIKI